jgi:ADP-ribose pyrophosphatase YjhB (NUDIX family)/ketosteroid isomerase-like protein
VSGAEERSRALDVVRSWFEALNSSDLAALTDLYAEGCVSEQIHLQDEGAGVHEGRPANRRMWEAFFSAYEGGFAGGAHRELRSLAAVETGWVHAEWVAIERRRTDGQTAHFAGYDHFLIEDGRIRRQRAVANRIEGPGAGEPAVAASSRLYPSRPIVGVGAVILVEGRVVLIKRRFEPLAGQWSLPGGTLELGETLQAGVAREILEETGLDVEVGPVVEVFDRILLDATERVRYHFVLIDYLCRPVGGLLSPASDVADIAAVEPGALAPYRLTPKAEAVIRQALVLAEEIGWASPRSLQPPS